MKIEILGWTLDDVGYSNVYSPVGYYLHAGLGDYGQAIDSLLIIAFLPKQLGKLTKAEKKSFGTLPKTTFKRKQRRCEMRFLSSLAVAGQVRSIAGFESCNRAMAEVAGVLASLNSKIKSTDDFGFPEFMADATSLLNKPFPDMKALEAAKQASKAKSKATNNKDPWASPDLDWDDDAYHPDARSILDEPFFWSRGNPFAPHGSDTGSDVLTMYANWRKKNTKGDPSTFLEETLRAWDMPDFQPAIESQQAMRQSFDRDEIAYRVSSEVALAVAFAELKHTADCPQPLAQLARCALTRLSQPFAINVAPSYLPRYKADLALMEAKLSPFAMAGHP